MRIEILSGNQKGQIVDMPQTEAECCIATGYGRSVEASPPPPAATADSPISTPKPPRKPPKGARRTGA